MSILSLKVNDKSERTKAVSRGSEEANLVLTQEYQEGDIIIIELEKTPAFIWLQVDEAIGRSLVYATGNNTKRSGFTEPICTRRLTIVTDDFVNRNKTNSHKYRYNSKKSGIWTGELMN